MQGHKYSHICNLWGKFLPLGMICTTTDTISIPVGEMYLYARMFCALAHMSSIPMGAINVSAWNLFLAKPVLWQLMILLPCTLAHMSSITMLTEVWPCANQTLVTNNLTVLTEVRAKRNSVNQGFPVYKQLYTHFEQNNILYEHQYGFRIDMSTVQALLNHIQFMYNSILRQLCYICILRF